MENSEVKSKRTPLRKRAIFILPNLFTTASLFFGFMSVLYSVTSYPETAAYCIFISAILDGFDGKVARLTGTESEFGVQYDSLADLIGFGMAPAILIWTSILPKDPAYANLSSGIAFIFLACVALRLARFNVQANVENPQKRFFIGLPSPAAGCTLAGYILFLPFFPEFVSLEMKHLLALVLPILVALLMVSRVRYFSFKEFDWVKKHPFQVLVLAIFLLVLIFSKPREIIFPCLFLYIFSGILYTFVYAPLRSRKTKKVINKEKENMN